jgi:hypothetical protein
MSIKIALNHGSSIQLSAEDLQAFRGSLIQAAIKYLEDMLMTNHVENFDFDPTQYADAYQTNNSKLLLIVRTKEARQLLRTIISTGAINYELLRKLGAEDDILNSIYGLIGLYKFTNHSSWNGYHSAGDSLDILTTLRCLRSYFHQLPVSLILKAHVDQFEDLFDQAVNTVTYVKYINTSIYLPM